MSENTWVVWSLILCLRSECLLSTDCSHKGSCVSSRSPGKLKWKINSTATAKLEELWDGGQMSEVITQYFRTFNQFRQQPCLPQTQQNMISLGKWAYIFPWRWHPICNSIRLKSTEPNSGWLRYDSCSLEGWLMAIAFKYQDFNAVLAN